MRGRSVALCLALSTGPLLGHARPQSQRFADLHRMLPLDHAPTTAIAMGDVDGDGDLDLLLGNTWYGNGGEERLYRNDGSGVFVDASSQVPANIDATYSLVLGDVDGDGDLDALIGNGGQDRLYLNDGSGAFADASVQLPAVDDSTYAAALGDVDGDGDLDAYLGNFGQDRLLLNGGGGIFTDTPSQIPANPDLTNAVALGDVDGDGDLDALTGNAYTGTFAYAGQNRLLGNNGSGVFTDATAQLPTIADYTNAVALGDLDADGDLDALIGNGVGNGYPVPNRLYLNYGPGTFADATSQLPATEGSTDALAVGDVDSDGDLDALLGSAAYKGGGYQNRLVVNDGSGIFAEATSQIPANLAMSSAVALGDVDADGDLDALIGNSYGSSADAAPDWLQLNDGSGVFTDAATHLPEAAASSVALGDLDGDGDLDAYVGSYPDRLYLSDGSGILSDASSQLPSVVGGTVDFALGDVDADADLDVFVVSSGLSRLSLNDGSASFTDATSQLPAIPNISNAVALGDVDADGDLDAWIGNGTGAVQQDRLYLNDGSGVFADATAQLPSVADATWDVALGDVDGDGDLDALVGNGFGLAPQDRLCLNDGSGVFADATAQLPAVPDDTMALDLGDVDGDGDLDLLIGNSGVLTPQPNRLQLNDGSGVFTDATAQLPAILDFTRAAALGDADGDGDFDAFIGTSFQQSRLFLNNGSGVFADATAQLPASSVGTVDIALGDVDGDGDLDALMAAEPSRLLFNLGRQLAWRGLPRLGKSLTLDLYGPAWGAWFLGLSLGPASVPVPPLGTLRLDPATLIFDLGGLLDAEGRASRTHAVPPNPSLVGTPLYWQAVVAAPARFTNVEITTFTDL